MNKFFFSYLVIFLFSFLVDKYHGQVNKKDNTKITMLVLLKNKFLDNQELTSEEALKHELKTIKESELYPEDFDKFERFLVHIFKYFGISINFCKEEKDIMHTSGLFNEFYVDVDSLSDVELNKYFDSIKERAHKLFSLIFYTNLIISPTNQNALEWIRVNANGDLYKKPLEYIGNTFVSLFNLKNTDLAHFNSDDFIVYFYTTYVSPFQPYPVKPLSHRKYYGKNNNLSTEELDEAFVKDEKENTEKDQNETLKANQNKKFENIINKILEKTLKEIFERSKKEMLKEIQNKIFENSIKEIFEKSIKEIFEKNQKEILREVKNKIFKKSLKEIFENIIKEIFKNAEKEILKGIKYKTLKVGEKEDTKASTDELVNNILKKFKFDFNLLEYYNLSFIFHNLLKLFKYSVAPNHSKNENHYLREKNILGDHVLGYKFDNVLLKQKHLRDKLLIGEKQDENIYKNKKDNDVYVSIEQNGIIDLLNIFNVKDGSITKNMKDLLAVVDELKVFNIIEASLFIQYLNEYICASYCFNITSTLELFNFVSFFSIKMRFTFTYEGLIVETSETHKFDTFQLEKIINLLNINKETIPLNCPCKYYSDDMISYNHNNQNSSTYFVSLPVDEFVNKFSTPFLLQHLVKFQETLLYIKKNGGVNTNGTSKVYTDNDYKQTAHYHNNYFFPPLKLPNVSYSNEKIFKFPDVDVVNVFYKGIPYSVNEPSFVQKLIIQEIKSKIKCINSFRTDDKIYPTYNGLGKDDNHLELQSKAPNGNEEVNRRHNKSFEQNKLRNTTSQQENDTHSTTTLPQYAFNTHEKSDEENIENFISDDLYDVLDDNVDYNADDGVDYDIDDDLQKEVQENAYDTIDEDEFKVFMENIISNRLIHEKKKEEIFKNTDNDAKHVKVTTAKTQKDDKVSDATISTRIINAKYFVYFFMNMNTWKSYKYCLNLRVVNKILKTLKYEEYITFKENYNNDTISLKFSSDLNTNHVISIEYFLFLLEKVLLITYLKPLCLIYPYEEHDYHAQMVHILKNTEEINSLIKNKIFNTYEIYMQKKQDTSDLSKISSKSMFSYKGNIFFGTDANKSILINSKDLLNITYIYTTQLFMLNTTNNNGSVPIAYSIYIQDNKNLYGSYLKICKNNAPVFAIDPVRKYISVIYNKILAFFHSYSNELIGKISKFDGTYIVYKLIIYNDNFSMPNLIIKSPFNIINISLLQSILEVLFDTRSTQQFFMYNGRYVPMNAFIILEEGINYLFYTCIINDHIIDIIKNGYIKESKKANIDNSPIAHTNKLKKNDR